MITHDDSMDFAKWVLDISNGTAESIYVNNDDEKQLHKNVT